MTSYLYKYGIMVPAIYKEDFSLCRTPIHCVTKFYVDRFGRLTTEEDIVYDKFPSYTNKSFTDVCIDRALEYKEINPVVLSSCGVDSLAVIASLKLADVDFTVMNVKTDETDEHIINTLKDYGVSVEVVDNPIFEGFLLDGNNGDQLNHAACFYDKSLHYDMELIKQKFGDWFNGVEFHNDYERLWWMSFCLKWRKDQYMTLPRWIEDMFEQTIDMSKYDTFFGTDVFSDWGYSNYHYFVEDFIHGKYKTNFKKVIKDAFAKLDIDDMGKTPSLKRRYTSSVFSNPKNYKRIYSGFDSYLLLSDKSVIKDGGFDENIRQMD